MGGRIPRACDSCYIKKIKCDAALPKCDYCCHRNLPCTFTRQNKKDVAKNHGTASGICNGRSGKPDLHLSTGPALGLHFPGRQKLPITLVRGIPSFSDEAKSWIYLRTGEPMNYSSYYESASAVQQSIAQDMEIMLVRSQTQSILPLPDISTTEAFLEEYLRRDLYQRYPILNRDLFQATLAIAYDTTRPYTRTVSHKACVFSFIALMCVICQDLVVQYPSIDGEMCAINARCLMVEALNGETSFELAQAATTLALHGTLCMSFSVAIHFNSIAARLVFLLGGHTAPSQNEASEPETSKPYIAFQIRNLFWICYFVDKDLVFRTGLPPAIDDSHCDLSLPPDYVATFYSPAQGYTIPATPIETATFAFDIRLCIIKSRIYTLLYSKKSFHQPEAEMEDVIRHLETTLGAWKRSLPTNDQPASIGFPCIARETKVPLRLLLTWIEYYHCASILHLARSHLSHGDVLRIVSGIYDMPTELIVPIEASRRILLQLGNVTQQESLTVKLQCMFQLSLAAVTIFWNILHSSTSCDNDLSLLWRLSTCLDEIQSRFRLPKSILTHLFDVSSYTKELHRLATRVLKPEANMQTG
ncbi:hypothetical protein BDW67DRAFT_170604 [Aspergillus spinulosporus]